MEVKARLVLGADSDTVASSGRSDSRYSDSRLALHLPTWSFHQLLLVLLLIARMKSARDLAPWIASVAASGDSQ